MKLCKNCGAQMEDTAVVCPSCGTAQQTETQPVAPVYQTTVYQTNPNYGGNVDSGGIGWGLLGCCLPIVGLILFLVWKDQKPRTAQAAGIGALISVGISVASYLLLIVSGAGLAMLGF